MPCETQFRLWKTSEISGKYDTDALRHITVSICNMINSILHFYNGYRLRSYSMAYISGSSV